MAQAFFDSLAFERSYSLLLLLSSPSHIKNFDMAHCCVLPKEPPTHVKVSEVKLWCGYLGETSYRYHSLHTMDKEDDDKGTVIYARLLSGGAYIRRIKIFARRYEKQKPFSSLSSLRSS